MLLRLLASTALILLAPPASAADRFVSTQGSDAGNDCAVSTSPCETVAHGLSEAGSSDTVKIAVGLYKENLVVDTAMTISLSGGWSGDFSSQDPAANSTRLRAAEKLPVVTVIADGIAIDLTADGFTIEKGKNFQGSGGSCDEVSGGGMCSFVRSAGDLTLSLSRMVFRKNRAEGSGGGLGADVFDAGSSLTLTVIDSTFEKNQARFGGGVYIFTDETPTVDATFDGVHFFRNLGGAGGGFGIGQAFLPTDQSAQVLIRNSTFEKNRTAKKFEAGDQGGGLFAVNTGCDMSGCPVTVENSVFFKNRSGLGGGVRSTGVELVNVTASRNRAGTAAGGVSARGIIRNSIVWGNNGGEPVDLAPHSGGTLDFEYSDVGQRTGLENDLGGNISTDPLFTKLPRGDVHLTAGSPAIDTGTCVGAPATDYEGDTRPSGVGCDMGADEFVP